jgi:hypothetical protein
MPAAPKGGKRLKLVIAGGSPERLAETLRAIDELQADEVTVGGSQFVSVRIFPRWL